MKQEERPGGAWPLNFDNYLASDKSAEALWSTALRSPALASLPEMRVRAPTTAKMVATLWQGHCPMAACDLQSLVRERSRDALPGQHVEHLIGVRPEPRLHRLLDHLDESVTTFVTCLGHL